MKRTYNFKFFDITKIESLKISSIKIEGSGHLIIETSSNLNLENTEYNIQYYITVNNNEEIYSDKNRVFIAKYLKEGINNIKIRTRLQVKNNDSNFVEFNYKEGVEIYV